MSRRIGPIPRGGRRTASVILAAAAVLVGAIAPTTAGAQEVPDANCPPITPGPTMGTVSTPQGGDSRFAQTFLAENTGGITRAQVLVGKNMGSSGDYVVQIVDATSDPFLGTFPTNTVLASASVPNAAVAVGSPTPVEASFGSAAPVTAGHAYAVLVTRPGSSQLAVSARFDNPCPGEGWTSPNQTGGFNRMGGLMPGDPPPDMLFSIFTTLPAGPQPEPAPQPQPTPKADRTLTLDANKTKVEKRRKVRLAGQINAPTNEAGCEPTQTVELQRKSKKAPDSAFQTFTQVQTDQTGSFDKKVKVKKTYVYRARAPETGACNEGVSNTQKVRVKKP